ncbi:molybdopterin-dependent oxidoreductase [Vibrio lentus]|nr:molybdopterin-dependent oxidoreductase [Vibrio lentus]
MQVTVLSTALRHQQKHGSSDDTACEMIVVVDNHMTSSAKYADIILPDLTTSEQTTGVWMVKQQTCLTSFSHKKRSSLSSKRKSIYEMCSQLAKRMGVEKEFTEGRTQEQWIEHLYAETRLRTINTASLRRDERAGYLQAAMTAPHRLRNFRRNHKANPLTTPSGKIEIYSEQLADIAKTWEIERRQK